MAIKVTDVPARLAETLVIDTDSDTTGVGSGNDVFTGVTKADKFYCWKIDNSKVNAVTYVKVQAETSYTLANDPDWRFYAPANSLVTYVFPDGQAFSNGISFIATSTADSANASQTDPAKSVIVTVLGGT
jgi:hypothetical protein